MKLLHNINKQTKNIIFCKEALYIKFLQVINKGVLK